MEIKRYRAATMRAALEQVKQELGADALVLETKEVRAGGFLGIGAQPAIELRVAAKPQSAPGENKKVAPPKSTIRPDVKPAARSLKVSSDNNAKTVRRPSSAAFAARAYASELTGNKSNSQPTEPRATRLSEPRINARNIELRDAAPRPARKSASLPAPEKSALPTAETAPVVSEVTSREFNRLREEMRGELRAMNFSMNALVARQVTYGDSLDGRRGQLHETFGDDPEVFDSPFYEIYTILTDAGLRPELARGAVRAGLANNPRQARNTETTARAGLVTTLPSIVNFAADPLAQPPGAHNAPVAMALVGPTGVGKTTTIAKLAARAMCRLNRRVVLVTLDTYRIAAAEQLRIYAEIIGANFHVANSIAELDSLVRRFSGESTVLIDTAGRSPAEITDEMDLGNYLRACDDILKLLVLPATTHPVDAHTAIRQFSLFGPDQLILTKMDETTRPGAAVSVAGDAALPLAYLCAGQRVPEDLERATPLTFASRVVRSSFALQEN